MARSSRTFPVTVTQLPLVRCAVCGRTLAHQKGAAGDVLTAHYAQAHAELLGGAAAGPTPPDAGD